MSEKKEEGQHEGKGATPELDKTKLNKKELERSIWESGIPRVDNACRKER